MRFKFYKETSFYLIPTIFVMPDLITWDDKKHDWIRDMRSVAILLCFLWFELGFEFDYKRKRR